MARAYGANASLLAAFESTYGSTPVDGYWQLPFVSTSLGSEQGLIANDLIGLGRDPSAPIRDVIKVEGDMVVPLDVRHIGLWLKALLGEPTSVGTGVVKPSKKPTRAPRRSRSSCIPWSCATLPLSMRLVSRSPSAWCATRAISGPGWNRRPRCKPASACNS